MIDEIISILTSIMRSCIFTFFFIFFMVCLVAIVQRYVYLPIFSFVIDISFYKVKTDDKYDEFSTKTMIMNGLALLFSVYIIGLYVAFPFIRCYNMSSLRPLIDCWISLDASISVVLTSVAYMLSSMYYFNKPKIFDHLFCWMGRESARDIILRRIISRREKEK